MYHITKRYSIWRMSNMEKNMRMEIINHKFERLGVINKFDMIQYNPKYSDIGSFELSCALNEENKSLIVEDNILWIEDGYAGVIQYIDKSSKNEIKVKGKLLSVVLNWRTVIKTYEANKPPTEIFDELVRLNFMTDGERKIEGFMFINNVNDDKTAIRYQVTGEALSDVFQPLSETYDIGYEVYLNMKEKAFEFTLFRGRDLTIDNKDGNKPVIFGTDFNNILTSEYVSDKNNYRNVAYVAGEGEGENRVVVEVKQTESAGFFRREIVVDARDLQKANSTTKMTDEEYNELLQQRGKEKLSELRKVESYDAELMSDAKTGFVYGKDYFLGDTVSVIDKNLGVILSAKITEATITFAEDGYTVEPTFGFGLPTLYDKLKKGVL